MQSMLERRWLLFLLIALAFRGLYIGIQLHYRVLPETPGCLSIETGDTKGYLDPVENLMTQGVYAPDYRMPGVAAPYWIFRQFLDVGMSRDAMVILQWLLSGLNVYVLALIALRLTGSQTTALIVYAAYLSSAYSSWFDSSIASDSLAVSCLILHAFLFQRGWDRKCTFTMLGSGVFLAWFIFLRPIGAALVPLLVLLLFAIERRSKPWKWMFALLFPFLLVDTVWALRNHRVNGTLKPLTNQGWFPSDFAVEVRAHVMHFVQGYGGNYIWWAPGSDIRWYGVWKGGADLDDEGRSAQPPPAYAFVDGYDIDSLAALSERIRRLERGGMELADSLAERDAINERFDHYAQLFKEKAPFRYHVSSRLLMFKHLVWQHGTESLIIKPFAQLPIGAKLFKVLQIGFYMFTFTFGTFGCMISLWNWRRSTSLLQVWVPVIVLYLVVVFPIGLRMCEWRYMAHPFPFALLMGIIFVHQVWSRRDLLRSR